MSQVRVLEVLGQSTGGIARHVARIVDDLDGRDGLALEVAGPPDLPVDMPGGVRPVIIPKGSLRGHAAAVRQLRALVRQGRYDVVHAHGLRAGIDSGMAARRTRARPMASLHNLALPEIHGRAQATLLRRLEPWLVRVNDRCLAASGDIAARLRTAAPARAGRVEVLHLGIANRPKVKRPAPEIRAELGVPPGGHLVTTVTRLVPQKAVDVLVCAVAELPPDHLLAVVGEGRLRADLEGLAGRLGVTERVRWLGYRDDAADYVAAADVFALSSVWEACSLAAQEAMALEVPVVSTDVGGMPELVRDGISGRLAPSGDPGALARALRATIGLPAEVRASMTAAARATLASDFSVDAMVVRLADHYRRLAGARR
jgi:glycosyltransferase involved in cell wall biosynthesis